MSVVKEYFGRLADGREVSLYKIRTDRLYAEELLEIPGPGWKRVGRKTLLHLLYLFSLERRAAAAPGTRPNGAEERRSEHV